MSLRIPLGRVGECMVRINLLFLVVLAVAAATGILDVYILAFVLVTLHEAAHALVARAYGFAVQEVELLPFGGVARMDGLFEHNPQAEFVIAAAGPALNLLLCMAALALGPLLGLDPLWITFFVEVNWILALLNLLPALPLDGGRMVRALLARHYPLREVTRLCAGLGMFCGVVLGALFVWGALEGVINLSLALMSVFLFLAAWREYRRAPLAFLNELSAKRHSLRAGALPIRALAAPPQMTLGALVRRFTPGHYHVVTVMDADCRTVGTLGEARITAEIARGGALRSLAELLSTRAR